MTTTMNLSIKAMQAIEAGASVEFVEYLVNEVMDRKARGMSQDGDAYRTLLGLAR